MSMLMRRAFMGGTSRTYAKLNPADKSPNIILSGGDLSFSSAAAGSVRANMSKTSGKWQFEVTVTGVSSGASGVGVADAASLLSTFPGGTSNSWGHLPSGATIRNAATVAVGTAYTTGDVITCAFDCGGNTIRWYKNGVVCGGPMTLSLATAAPFPMVGGQMSGTCNFGATSLAYPVAGYNPGVYV